MSEETRETLRPLSDEEVTLWLTVTRHILRRPGTKAPLAPPPKSEKPVKTVSPALSAQVKPEPPAAPGHPGPCTA